MADCPDIRRRQCLFLLIIFSAWFSGRAMAQTNIILTWSSTGGGNWSNANNWGNAGTPTNGDTLIFPQGSGVLNNDLTGLTLNQVIFANNSGSWIVSGQALTVTNGIEQAGSGASNNWDIATSLTASDTTVNVVSNSILTISGPVNGTGGPSMSGPGSVILNGANTYTGPTLAAAGSLEINSAQPQSPVTVLLNATLTGGGTVGNLTCNGILRPGTNFAQGTLACSNLILAQTAIFNPELLCTNAGYFSSQLDVRGVISLRQATLREGVVMTYQGAITPAELVLIQNSGGSPISGTFAGLRDGATVTVYDAEPNLYAEQWEVARYQPIVNYALGGTTNVTLRSQQALLYPNPVFTGGDGSPGFQPDECYILDVNLDALVPMTDVSAVLSSATPGVIVTQPYSTFPNMLAGQPAESVTPFEVSALPSLACGTVIQLQLALAGSDGSDIVPLYLQAGQTSATPDSFNASPSLTIPKNGSVNSSITVFSAPSNIVDATITVNLTEANVSRLTLALVAPNGTTYVLANGPDLQSGANFEGTTFDDAAAFPIYEGSPPFTGTYQPETPLTSLAGTFPSGTWTLVVSSTNASSTGQFVSWGINLYPSACSGGSGPCRYCQPAITGVMNGSNPTTTGLTPNGLMSSCGQPIIFPGATITNANYSTYTFTNTSPDAACVGVELDSTGEPLLASVYANSFNPANAAINYMGDAGLPATTNAPGTFSVTIPAGAVFVIVVSEVNPSTGGGYTLNLSGLPCPPPVLQAQHQSTNVVISWPTSAGGYLLETTPALPGQNWTLSIDDPLSSGGWFNVTNFTGNSPGLFYRLYKP
ncbi:MAG TPA: proprotein convertase P-domain-containing protein [Verrucomicrobiae bacterium]